MDKLDKKIAQLVKKGFSQGEIAKALSIPVKEVKLRKNRKTFKYPPETKEEEEERIKRSMMVFQKPEREFYRKNTNRQLVPCMKPCSNCREPPFRPLTTL